MPSEEPPLTPREAVRELLQLFPGTKVEVVPVCRVCGTEVKLVDHDWLYLCHAHWTEHCRKGKSANE